MARIQEEIQYKLDHDPDFCKKLMVECEAALETYKRRGDVVAINDLKIQLLQTDTMKIQIGIWGKQTIFGFADTHAAFHWFDAVQHKGKDYAISLGLSEPVKVEKEVPNSLLVKLFEVTLDQYPACCALTQANYFSYLQALSQESVDKLLYIVTKAYRDCYLNRPARYVFNFVEFGSRGIRPTRTSRQRRVKDMLTPLEGVPKDAEIQYPKIYDWAKRQEGYQEMVCYNDNSGNIIHTGFVVPSYQAQE